MNETNSGVIKEPSITFSRLETQNQPNILGKDYINSDNPIEDAKRAAEAEVILAALNTCGGNKSKAAKLLKIPRPLLYQKMNRLGI
jgi:DNA-binding NtrC family response regulator